MTPEEMLLEGWCDDCDGDPAKCITQGYCDGEKRQETSDE